MEKINLTLNGQKIEVNFGTTVKDILTKFFTSGSEFIVQKNSGISVLDFNKIFLDENDVLEVISYLDKQMDENKKEYKMAKKKIKE